MPNVHLATVFLAYMIRLLSLKFNVCLERKWSDLVYSGAPVILTGGSKHSRIQLDSGSRRNPKSQTFLLPTHLHHTLMMRGISNSLNLSSERIISIGHFAQVLDLRNGFDKRALSSALINIWHSPFCISAAFQQHHLTGTFFHGSNIYYPAV